MAYYITIHYVHERKFNEAVILSQHTFSEISNCCEFAEKNFLNNKSIGLDPSIERDIRNHVEHLEEKIRPMNERL